MKFTKEFCCEAHYSPHDIGAVTVARLQMMVVVSLTGGAEVELEQSVLALGT